MKNLLCILTLLFSVLSMNAENTKQWSDGPLLWKDFDGIAMTGVPSYMKSELGIETQRRTDNGKSKIMLAAVAKMNKERSFADSLSKTEQRLRYHQLQFDILEGYRRDLQLDINSGMTGIEADDRLRHYNNMY